MECVISHSLLTLATVLHFIAFRTVESQNSRHLGLFKEKPTDLDLYWFRFNFCLLRNFACFLGSSDDFFSKSTSEKISQEYNQSVKQFGSRSRFVGPDLGPNGLPRLSADGTRRQRVNNDLICVQFKMGVVCSVILQETLFS